MESQSTNSNQSNGEETEANIKSRKGESDVIHFCPICTNEISSRALTDSCIHEFCFDCIQQWSQNHSNCPVCRQTYRSIICNIVSEEVFEQIPVHRHNEYIGYDIIDNELIDAVISSAMNQVFGHTDAPQTGSAIAVNQVLANIDFNQLFKCLVESVSHIVIQNVFANETEPIHAAIDVNGDIQLNVRLIENDINSNTTVEPMPEQSAPDQSTGPNDRHEESDANNENQNPYRSSVEDKTNHNSTDLPQME